jgi:hypothetical protein
MKPSFSVALTLACCLAAAPRLHAQAPTGDAPGTSQSNSAGDAQKPAAGSPQSGSTQPASNPFPEDTSSVPVLPSASASSSATPPPTFSDEDSGNIRLPGADNDPVRSPDDPVTDSASAPEDGFSSSLNGIDQLLPPPDSGKAKKNREQEPTHQEGAAEDIQVGGFYLERKDWKGALSRFESALVLDPENPEVYWGLAEAERHLGDFAAARAHYQKVIEYDPESHHGKEAVKALKEPELAHAPAVSSNSSAAQPQH